MTPGNCKITKTVTRRKISICTNLAVVFIGIKFPAWQDHLPLCHFLFKILKMPVTKFCSEWSYLWPTERKSLFLGSIEAHLLLLSNVSRWLFANLSFYETPNIRRVLKQADASLFCKPLWSCAVLFCRMHWWSLPVVLGKSLREASITFRTDFCLLKTRVLALVFAAHPVLMLESVSSGNVIFVKKLCLNLSPMDPLFTGSHVCGEQTQGGRAVSFFR